MYTQRSILFLLCETALHAGSGDDIGIVDLPIQREKHTSFPKIEASSLKGAMREAFESAANSKSFDKWDEPDVMVHRLFGLDESGLNGREEKLKGRFKLEDDKEGHDRAGCVAFTDARLLLFPVKSMKGVFAWITCPQVLNKLASDLSFAGIQLGAVGQVKNLEIPEGQALTASSAPLVSEAVILEEYAYEAQEHEAVRALAEELVQILYSGEELSYWNTLLKRNLVVLNDTDFRDFTLMSTEVITRTKIDNQTGTVEEGALFTEEYLPNDSVLYALMLATDEYGKNFKNGKKKTAEEVMTYMADRIGQENEIPYFQLGANATLGKGILKPIIKQNNHG